MAQSIAERIYCSEQNPGEPMPGTADHVGVWVLLEYKPTWKPRALQDNSLGRTTRDWLDDNLKRLEAAGMRPRPQFVRQPDVDSDAVRLFVGWPGHLRCFHGAGYGFLESLDLHALISRPDDFAAEVLKEPHYFVCTNGQRDVCCARHGLPCYAALRERVGQRVWQVTHLGGHRFAPNVLVLPQGALYGRVHAAQADTFVNRVEAGELCFPLLRGRSWYAKPVQAAEALLGRSDLRLLHVEGDERMAKVSFAAAADRAGDHGDSVLEITVRQQDQGIDVLASCGEEKLKRVHPYQRVRSA